MNKMKFVPDLVTGRLKEEDAKKYFSRFGWFAFAFTLINIVAQNAIAIAASYFPAVYEHWLFWQLLSVIPLYGIALPLSYVILRPLPTVLPIDDKWRAKELMGGLCVCVTLMLAGSYISNIFVNFFSIMRGTSLQNPVEVSVSSMPLWATLLFVCILAPILEEVFFRGILCRKLLMLGEGYAIVLPAAFFALAHGNFFQVFYAFVLGCFFSFVYVRTGKLIYTIIYHALINFLGSFVISVILNYVDLEAMLGGEFAVTAENIFGFIALLWYEAVTYGLAIAGIVIMVKQYKKIRLQTGLLPPPEGKGVSCVLLNAGVAAAITLFAITMLASIV